jgi:hypothetical protein
MRAACQAAIGNWSGWTDQPMACASADSWAQQGLLAGNVLAEDKDVSPSVCKDGCMGNA